MTRHALRLLLSALLLVAPGIAGAQTQDVVIYYHTDAVGSVRALTDANGTEIQRYDYLPFGEPWPSSAPVQDPRRFTGTERDPETGLDYFGARYYASGLGRFTVVDPDHINGNIADPQSWNAYAYARNNPLLFTDPDGREYEICADGATRCGYASDQYFLMLQRRPGAGVTLRGGKIYVSGRLDPVGSYRQISVDPTLDSFIRQSGDLAAAELKYATIGIGISAVLGATGGLAAGAFSGLGGGDLIAIGGQYGLRSPAVLNRIIGDVQRKLLDSYFKSGKLPEGVERRALDLYLKIAKQYVAEGRGGPAGLAEQTRRIKLIEAALKRLP